MGAKVAQNIQADMLETTGYKDIAKSLSEMPEFKEFAKGDITEDEFSDLIVQPVEKRKEETYQNKLKENSELLHQEISTSGKIEEIKQRLQKLHGLNIRENDILTIQNEKNRQEKKAGLETHQEEQLSPEESKKRLKEAKKAAKNSSNASFNDLSALAALKDKFNRRK